MEVSEGFRVAQALGVLHLTHPPPGAREIFNTHEYSRIDFRPIVGQWQRVHPYGRSLVIVFADGAEIQLTDFFGGNGPADGRIAQIDDATFLSANLFLLKYSTAGSATEPQAGK